MQKGLKLTFILLFITFTAVLLYRASTNKPVVNDTKEYEYLAHNALENNVLYAGNLNKAIDYRLFSKRPLGFPLFLLLQHQTPWIIYLAQGILLILNFFLGIELLKNLNSSSKAFTIYYIGFLLNLVLILHSGLLLADLLFCTVVTLFVVVLMSNRINNYTKISALGILWALGLFIKPIMVPSLVLVPFLLIYYKRKNHRWFPALLLPFIVYLIFSGINYQNTNQFEYSNMAKINMAQYNAKYLIAYKYGSDSASQFVENKSFIVPNSPKDYSTYLNEIGDLGFSTLTQNYTSYLYLHALGTVKMLFDPGRFDVYTFFNEPTNNQSLTELLLAKKWTNVSTVLKKSPLLFSLLIILLLVNIIKLIGIALALMQVKKTGFLFLVFTYFAIIPGPVGGARYLIPVSIIMLILATVGWEKALDFFQKRPKR